MSLWCVLLLGIVLFVGPRVSSAQQATASCEARYTVASQYVQSLLVNVIEREASMADVRMGLLRALGKLENDQTPLAALVEEVRGLKTLPVVKDKKK